MLERTPLPRYAQVADAIRNRIRRGAWQRGEAIPTIDRLMAEFGVGRVTVRQAIQLLAREGLLSPEQGRGTFVTADPGSRRRLQVQTSLADLAEMYRGDAPDLEHIVETDEAAAADARRTAAPPTAMSTCAASTRARAGATAWSRSTSPARSSTSPRRASGASSPSRSCSTCRASPSSAPTRRSTSPPPTSTSPAASTSPSTRPSPRSAACSSAPDDLVIYVAEASYRGDYIHLEMDLLKSPSPR